MILFPYVFSTIGPPKTCVAKFDTEPDADAEGAAVFEVLARAGLPSRLNARRLLWSLLRLYFELFELYLLQMSFQVLDILL